MSTEAKRGLTDGSSILGWNGPAGGECQVKLYDFRRPDKFSKDQIRTVQNIHEDFARYAETAFSAIARKPCSLHVSSIDQLTYEEFIQSISFPATCFRGKMPPLRGHFLMDIEDPIKNLLLDRTFGSVTVPGATPASETTPLEQKTLLQAMKPVAAALSASWKPIVKNLEISFGSIESNPQFIQIVPPSEMIVLATLEFSCGDVEGLVNFVYPYLTIEPIVNRLGAQYWYASVKQLVVNEDQKRFLYAIPVPVNLSCEAESLSIESLRKLKPGSLVHIPAWPEDKGMLRSEGTVIAKVNIDRKKKKGTNSLSAAAQPYSRQQAGTQAQSGEDSLRSLVADLESSVSGLGSSLGDSIAQLTAEVKKLEGRQEDLGDRILFAQNDESAVRAQPKSSSSLNAVSGGKVEMLSMLLDKERNQLAALVLSILDDGLGARVLEGIGEARRPDIVKRVGTMEYVQADVVQVVEETLMEKMQGLHERAPRAGGIDKVVGILNKTSRATERDVIMSLSDTDHDFAEDIKRNMFVFEDIVLIDDASLRETVKKAGIADIVLALKGSDPKASAMLLARFDALGMPQVRNDLASSGRARLSDVEAAGLRVVEAVKALEQEGLIYIERGSED